MRIKKLSVAFLFIPLLSSAEVIKKCGIYEAEGLLAPTTEGQFRFLLSAHTSSQITLSLSTRENVEHLFGAIPATLRFEISSPCQNECDAKLLRVVKRLSPLHRPRRFSPKLAFKSAGKCDQLP